MPKDEFDFDDPLELSGVGFFTEEDTTEPMTDCFVEEFLRLGYNHKQILALFRNPHYLGMNMVLQNRGEQFVRERIREIFAVWGKVVTWANEPPQPLTPALSPSDGERENGRQSVCETDAPSQATRPPDQFIEVEPNASDPIGAAIPNLNK